MKCASSCQTLPPQREIFILFPSDLDLHPSINMTL